MVENSSNIPTPGDDVLEVDSPEGEFIFALAGNDKITGNVGRDTLFGGSGNDTIIGKSSNDFDDPGDILVGGEGDDSITGSLLGDDLIFGSSGNDTLRSLTGDSTLVGGEGDDLIDGDVPFGSEDLLIGDAGDDTILGGNAQDTLVGGSGNDSLVAGESNDLLFGGEGNDILTGDALFNGKTMFGGSGNDTLLGNNRVQDIAAYTGDPFEGRDVSAPGRQVISDDRDLIDNFFLAGLNPAPGEVADRPSLLVDKFSFDAVDYGISPEVNFTSIDANAGEAIAPGTNIVVLLNNDNNTDTPSTVEAAADRIADLASEDGAGLFVYYNSESQENSIVYSTNLNSNEADLKVVTTSKGNTLPLYQASNFSFDDYEFDNNGTNFDEPYNFILEGDNLQTVLNTDNGEAIATETVEDTSILTESTTNIDLVDNGEDNFALDTVDEANFI